MLYPEIELAEDRVYCVCGAPNFRNVTEFHKPLYKIYKITIPVNPCGSVSHYLCENCVKRIYKRIMKFKEEN